MKVIKTQLDGCLIIQPQVYTDQRGFFLETFSVEKYKQLVGIDLEFVQDNALDLCIMYFAVFISKTKQQGLVRVTTGEVYDVAVDIRKNSPTYGKWIGVTLSEENKKQVWIPPGFAHGFLVTSDYAEFEYKCTEYYDPDDEEIILWSDPSLNISWPSKNPELSKKDSSACLLSELNL